MKINTAQLKKALLAASRFAPTTKAERNKLPECMQWVHLLAADNMLTLTAGNTDHQIKIELKSGDSADFEYCLDLKAFKQVVGKIKTPTILLSDVVSLELTKHDASDYPNDHYSPVAEDTETTDGVYAQPRLVEALGSIIKPMARHDVRHYLNGALWRFQGDRTHLVSADGHRLAKTVLDVDCQVRGQSDDFIVRNDTIAALYHLVKASKNRAQVFCDRYTQLMRFSLESSGLGVKITTRVIDGRYPDVVFAYFHGKPSTYEYKINRVDLITAVKHVREVANPKFRGIELRFDGSGLECYSNGLSGTEASQTVAAPAHRGSDVPITKGCNADYLLDALNAFDCETVTFATNGEAMNEIRITDGSDRHTQIVTPFRK